MTVSNDKHQEELIAIQTNYNERIRSLTNEIEQLKNNNKETASKASSNKSDDGWFLNGIKLNLIIKIIHYFVSFQLKETKSIWI